MDILEPQGRAVGRISSPKSKHPHWGMAAKVDLQLGVAGPWAIAQARQSMLMSERVPVP